MRVTIKYGLNSITKDIEAGSTVNDFVGDPDVQAALGYAENVDALIGGAVVDGFTTLAGGEEITVRVKANAKA